MFLHQIFYTLNFLHEPCASPATPTRHYTQPRRQTRRQPSNARHLARAARWGLEPAVAPCVALAWPSRARGWLLCHPSPRARVASMFPFWGAGAACAHGSITRAPIFAVAHGCVASPGAGSGSRAPTSLRCILVAERRLSSLIRRTQSVRVELGIIRGVFGACRSLGDVSRAWELELLCGRRRSAAPHQWLDWAKTCARFGAT